jgi:RimJ/RimL family protein N-acetyltransferase
MQPYRTGQRNRRRFTKEADLNDQSPELPVFETKRLRLRGVLPCDIDSYTRGFVDFAVIGELSAAVPWPYPAGGVADYVNNVIIPNQGNGRWVWGIFLKTDPHELIGVVDLWREGRPENRGFWLARRCWGQGLMTEAVIPVMDYAFAHLGFEKLVFANAVGNLRSRRVKEKTGARLVRTEPAAFINPAYREREVWELTRDAWTRFRSGAPDLR